MAATDAWTAKCEEWAQQLRQDAGGNIPNGLHAVVGELVDQYGAPALLDAVANANAKRHADAYELATWANQLVDAARLMHYMAADHPPTAWPTDVLDNVLIGCEKVSELAGRVTNEPANQHVGVSDSFPLDLEHFEPSLPKIARRMAELLRKMPSGDEWQQATNGDDFLSEEIDHYVCDVREALWRWQSANEHAGTCHQWPAFAKLHTAVIRACLDCQSLAQFAGEDILPTRQTVNDMSGVVERLRQLANHLAEATT